MKVLVTGGAGFIGSTLVKRLVRDGTQVDVIDNLWRGTKENLKEDNSYIIDMENNFYLSDLTNYSKCLEIIRNYDVVYHLADIVGGIHFVFSNEEFVFKQNILIDTNVITACKINLIPQLVYVGTACSYPKHLQMQRGIVQLKEKQTYPAEPESSYGWSKLMGEYQSELARKSSNIDIGLLRFHNVYGPGASFDPKHSQVIPSLINKVINIHENSLSVWGSGNQYRDFVYIDDIIEALIKVVKFGMNKGVIQIGSEKATTIKSLAKMIVKISGKDIKIDYETSKPEGDYGRIANCKKAKEILKWKVNVDIKDGLERTYKWIFQNLKKSK